MKYTNIFKSLFLLVGLSLAFGLNAMDSTYEVEDAFLTSLTDGELVAWGKSSAELGKSVSNDWLYLSTKKSEWMVFKVVKLNNKFYLQPEGANTYVYSSGAKKFKLDASNKTAITINSDGTVSGGSTVGTYVFNSTGIRPYTNPPTTAEDVYLFKVTSASAYTITATPNNSDWGSVTVSGTKITAWPADGYRVKSGEAGYSITTGTATVTNNGNNTFSVNASTDCSIIIYFEKEATESAIEIVEVAHIGSDYGVVIEHDLPDGAASITLSQKEEHQEGNGKVATDLFFSKYFEGAGSMKLLAIFNGTRKTINLSGYKIYDYHASGSSTSYTVQEKVDLSSLDKIAAGQEIIFYAKPNASSDPEQKLVECSSSFLNGVASKTGLSENPRWIENSGLVFNGNDALVLKKGDVVIDVIGALNNPQQANAKKNCRDEESWKGTVKNMDYGKAPADFPNINLSGQETYADYGVNMTDPTIDVFTARCILFRNKEVTTGDSAVKYNLDDFTTFTPEEWSGRSVCTSKARCTQLGWTFKVNGTTYTDNSQATCNSYEDLALFDYSKYYVTYDEIATDIKLDDIDLGDGTYFIAIPEMKDRACRELKIEVKNSSSVVIDQTPFDVPIIIDAAQTTADPIFDAKKDTCKECDVVILNGGKLTKADDSNKHWGDSARVVDIYAGGKLIIPASKEYIAENLVLRAHSVHNKYLLNSPEVIFFNDQSKIKSVSLPLGPTVGQRVRLETGPAADPNFYMVSFPYEVNIANIMFTDGTAAVQNTDYWIYVYDGQRRAQEHIASGNWVSYTGTKLNPGIGYLLAISERSGHTYRELYFPMATAALADGETDTKEATVNAWGLGDDIGPNHKGWNFVSNPFLRGYQSGILNNTDGGVGGKITLGYLVQGEDGYWTNDGTTVPYVTLLKASGTEYEQKRVADVDLPAFQPFFVQIGVDGMSKGQAAEITYKPEYRVSPQAASIRRMTTDRPTVSSLGLLIEGAEAVDNCGIVIGEQYGPAYELMADLSKEFGSAYSLKAYTLQDGDNMRLAFHAMHPDRLANTIPVGVRMPATAEYTFRIDKRYDLSDFEHVWLHDAETGEYTDLLYNDYTFNGTKQQNDNRFKLTVALRPKTPTDVDHVLSGIFVNGRDGALMISGLPEEASVYVYDLNGRLLVSDHTQRLNTAIYPLSTGVYQVRVEGNGQNALLKAIVK